MKGVNKVIVLGNLGKDPETRYQPSGAAITNATVATTERWKDKNSGQHVDKTEWHRIVFFNRLAEVAGEYLKKGSKVYIEGKLQTRKWQDNNGHDRWTTEIIASSLQMLDSKDGNQQSNNQRQHSQQQNNQQNQQQQNQTPSGYDDFDDDIPF